MACRGSVPSRCRRSWMPERRRRSRPSTSCSVAGSSERRRSRSFDRSSPSADMPRSAWLAVGATGAALAVPVLGDRAGLTGVAVALGLGLGGAIAPSRTRRTSSIGVALGIALIAFRVLLAPPLAGPSGSPTGEGPWMMRVESVGSPREGSQVATLASVDLGADGFRLAATLPRYPAIEPFDVVVVGGRVRPRPDSDYGDYLARLGAWGTLDARS